MTHAEFVNHPCKWEDKQGYYIQTPQTAGEYIMKGGSDTYNTFDMEGNQINNGCCYPISHWLSASGNNTFFTSNPDILCNSEYITSEDKFAESSLNILVWVGIVVLLVGVAVTL